MPSHEPTCYTALKPFAALFAKGVPMLMYHKLGPRPSRVKMKGLYVSNQLFERQLSELRRTGFSTADYGLPADANGNPSKRIVLTFDDGFVNALRFGVPLLARHHFRAIQFLVADRLGQTNDWDLVKNEVQEPLMNAMQVKEWLAAGHEIGSHTLTHPFLTRISARQAREEICASKKKLEDSFGFPIRHFCHPYGDTNPAVQDFIRDAGYETACTTAFGVNTPSTPPLELKRIMARHQSLSFKALAARLARFKFP